MSAHILHGIQWITIDFRTVLGRLKELGWFLFIFHRSHQQQPQAPDSHGGILTNAQLRSTLLLPGNPDAQSSVQDTLPPLNANHSSQTERERLPFL